jgi:ABC-type ATPase with predicted acetyltransferase domain
MDKSANCGEAGYHSSFIGGCFVALINCSECGNKVSELASRCPHCGAPVAMRTLIGSTPIQTVINVVTAIVLVLLVIILLYIGVYIPLHHTVKV